MSRTATAVDVAALRGAMRTRSPATHRTTTRCWSHGTHEFYRERAVITKRLIAEKGFTTVAVEPTGPTPIA